MLHASAVATRRRPGHRLRRPVGARQDHRLPSARPRLRLCHRRDPGGPSRRRRSSPTRSHSRSGERPGHKLTEPASALGLRPHGATRAAARGARAARSRPGVEQPYVESVAVTEVLPELVPQTSHPLASSSSPSAPSPRSCSRPAECDGSSTPRPTRCPPSSTAYSRPPIPTEPLLTDVAKTPERGCDCFSDLLEPTAPVSSEADRAGLPAPIDGPTTLTRSSSTTAARADPGQRVVLDGRRPDRLARGRRLDRG